MKSRKGNKSMTNIFPAIREFNFPQIPKDIIDNLSSDYQSYVDKWSVPSENSENKDIYRLTNSHNKDLDAWCKENICKNVTWEFQIIAEDTEIHRDHRPYNSDIESGFPRVKFVYQLATGGNNVLTEIYDLIDNKLVLAETYKFELHKWYLFNVQLWHRVIGITPGQTRFAVVGHIF